MRIKAIHLHNFMPFKGDHVLNLNITEGRNVVVIHGDNMRGKTSLLNAIRWCLYNTALGRHLRRIPTVNLINTEAANERDWHMFVELDFEHEGTDFLLRRSVNKKDLIDSPNVDEHLTCKTSLLVGGNAVRADQLVDAISRVMPQDISRFFLFDGELLQEYEQLVQERSVQSDRIRIEIEKVLGVPALLHARNDMALLKDRYQKQLAKQGSQEKRFQAQADQLQEFQVRRTSLEVNIQSLRAEERSLVVEIEDLSDQLEKMQRAEAVQQQITSVRRQIEALRAESRNLAQERLLATGNLWLDVIAPLVADRTSALRKQRDDAAVALRQSLVADADLARLRAAIDTTACQTCLQPIPADRMTKMRADYDSLVKKTDESKQAAAELSSIELRLHALPKLQSSNEILELKRVERRLAAVEIEAVRLEGQRSDLEAQVLGADLDKIRANRERHDLLNRELGTARNVIQRALEELAELNRKITALSNAITASPTGAIKQISFRVSTSQALYDVFHSSIDILRDKLRSDVEHKASETFGRLITDSAYSGLRINEQYGLQMLGPDGKVVPERSSGAEQIVALSLIDGLNKVAAKSGPVIMDTPFGRLDPRHRKKVLMYLPEMAEQVVLLVHEGELDLERDLTHISDKVARAFRIERVSSSHSRLEVS